MSQIDLPRRSQRMETGRTTILHSILLFLFIEKPHSPTLIRTAKSCPCAGLRRQFFYFWESSLVSKISLRVPSTYIWSKNIVQTPQGGEWKVISIGISRAKMCPVSQQSKVLCPPFWNCPLDKTRLISWVGTSLEIWVGNMLWNLRWYCYETLHGLKLGIYGRGNQGAFCVNLTPELL